MLTEYEQRKLRHDMERELNPQPGVVLKYAVMLLLIIGLAWGRGGIEGPARGVSPSPGSCPALPDARPDFA
jgi:hypothetical protein